MERLLSSILLAMASSFYVVQLSAQELLGPLGQEATNSNIIRGQLPQACTGELLVDQPPNMISGIFSDDACVGCPDPPGTGQQILAENFALEIKATITEIAIWGGYFSENELSDDNFTVIIHGSDPISGLPDNAIYTENSVSSTRTATGITYDVVGSMIEEFQWVLVLETAVELPPGVYWAEIFNSTPNSDDDFIWETADRLNDLMLGIAVSFEAPGANWIAFTTGAGMQDLALQICGSVLPDIPSVPTLSKNGKITIFLILLLTATYSVRRFSPK